MEKKKIEKREENWKIEESRKNRKLEKIEEIRKKKIELIENRRI